MFGSSLRLGTLFGIRILVHYSWAIIFLLLTSSLYAVFSENQPAWSNKLSIVTAVITSLLFFLSIILHELGHSLVAMSRGIRVHSITLFIFGGLAQTETEPDTPATEFWIAIAGPLVSYVLAFFFWVLNRVVGTFSGPVAESFEWLSSINFIVATFNLIPGFPLDGGRVFRAMVWGFTSDAKKSMRWAVLSGKTMSFGLMGLGLLATLQTGSLINGLWILAIGWFLWAAAEASGRAFNVHRLLSSMSVAQVMRWDVPYIEASTSITECVAYQMSPSTRRAFLVREHYQIVGLVTLRDCNTIPQERWPITSVRDIMTPAVRLHTVTPDTDLAEVLRNMEIHSVRQAPVVDKEQIVGWIERNQVLRLLQEYKG